MQTYFHKLNRSELELILQNCNLTTDEIIMLEMASRRCSDIQIAFELSIATSTVTKRKRVLSRKVHEFVREIENMTVIYINGKPVTKDEIPKYEIQLESVKRILVEKLTKPTK